MKSFQLVVGVLVGAVAGFALRGSLVQAPLGTPVRAAEGQAARAAPQPAAPSPIYKVLLGDAPAKGDAGAKVTIVEFSDFQCPYCGQAIGTLDQLEKLYGNDLRIVFKHDPLPMHPDAPYAARAAVAAGKQGKFWEMHDKLFAANNSHQPGALSQEKVVEMARALGLDVDRFKADAASPEAGDLVSSDQAQAQRLGAFGTPSFFINGAKIAGAQPLENFKALIDAQRKRADELLSRGVARDQLYDKLIENGLEGQAPPDKAQAPAPQVRDVDPGDGPARGGKRPKVTIVEFSDFQCPFCGSVAPTLAKLEETYKDDLRLVFRNEPLPMHPNALSAAKAAMAAARQGKFWQMHDLMFAHQQDLSEAKYEEWAKQVGLDVARWKKDKDSPQVAAQIDADSSYARQVGADGTPTFFIDGKMIPGALPFDAFKSVIDEQMARADAALKRGVKHDKLYAALLAENLAAAKSAPAADASPRAQVDPGDAPALGSDRAKVTVVEWSDFECPYCGRVEPTLQQLREKYGDKVRFVWKNQPLPMHQSAMPAAEAALAAAEQGKFWPMHDKLFQHQNELSPALYDRLARELGLDLARFHASIDAHAQQARIRAEMAEGARLGAGGTPTFFINGRKLVGAQPAEAFEQIIDAELAAGVAHK